MDFISHSLKKIKPSPTMVITAKARELRAAGEKIISLSAGEPDFDPAGDQPKAINDLIEGINKKEKDQVLMGVTGSGKTFTMAHVIKTLNKPTLIMAPNKTLAAQLYGEMKAVSYTHLTLPTKRSV